MRGFMLTMIIVPSYSTGAYDFKTSFDLCAHDYCNVIWINSCSAMVPGKEMNFKNIDEGHQDNSENIHFLYNRVERLKNAPKIVQDYYAGKVFNYDTGVKGLFKSLVSTKTNRFLLISIILFLACIYLFSFLSKNQNSTACGFPVQFESFSYNERIYVSLKFLEKKLNNKEYMDSSDVSVIFYGVNNDGEISYKSEEFFEKYQGKEFFLRADFPDYDIIKVEAEISVKDKKDRITAKIKKRS